MARQLLYVVWAMSEVCATLEEPMPTTAQIRMQRRGWGYGSGTSDMEGSPAGIPGLVDMSKTSTYRNSMVTGFSILELLVVVSVVLVLTSMAIPAALSAMKSYQLDAAADSASGAIQGARYQAIMHGYSYQLDFNSTTNQFQVSSEVPPAVTFSTVGSAVPISGSNVTMGVGTASSGSTGHLIFQFKPNGSVSITSGQSMPGVLTIAFNGTTKHLTVSNYGSISTTSTTP